MHQIDTLSRYVPRDQVIRLRYEDLCRDVEGTMRKLCEFLNLDFRPEMVARKTQGLHHLGGSPSKLDPTRSEIREDRRHDGKFTPAELALMQRIAGREAANWGYDR